ncbi:MAG TPA: CocE/NonD family hydrolase [Stellaceae bacterium]|nr:CocE/NonD family hydrolase [Stellaceae bacterium]
MRGVTELPFAVREIENLWIPLSDGVRLAARVWLPQTAGSRPVPAVLEYIPYRKRDMTALRDGATHGYLAGHGYACIRLDVRGVGDSEGVYGDQFTSQYVDDAVEAIAWLARQPWCSGEVAMFGLSWGAAIAMQTAERRPPALKTIVCAAGIDDRYALRYPGGCLSTATLRSIVAQMSYATRPPDPAIVGERWRDMWLARLSAARPMTEAWLGHPCRDEAWRSASIDYSEIACPVLMSAGWADPAFASTMLRMIGGLSGPRLGIFGPWAHRYPHLGIPGPAIGYLQETLRWLDHWLKGRQTGIMHEPMLMAWMPSGFTVSPTPDDRPGRWISEPQWPAPTMEPQTWWLGLNGLTPSPQEPHRVDLPSALVVGSGAGEFMPIFSSERGPELPGDQSREDRTSLVFDTAPLDRVIEIIGIPTVLLDFEANEPGGQIVVRLCEVTPDGRSRRLSWGARNLALGDDFSAPRRPRVNGQTIEVPLFGLADSIAPGNRLRLAVSTSYWPMLWPAAKSSRVTLNASRCRVLLPARVPRSGDGVAIGAPEAASSFTWTTERPGGYRREEMTDPATGEHVLTITEDMGTGRIEEIGLSMSESTIRTFRIHPENPSSAALETQMTCRFARGDWSAETSVRGRITASPAGIQAKHALKAREGKRTIYDREWRESV